MNTVTQFLKENDRLPLFLISFASRLPKCNSTVSHSAFFPFAAYSGPASRLVPVLVPVFFETFYQISLAKLRGERPYIYIYIPVTAAEAVDREL